VNPDGIGRRQNFTGSTIYWKLNEAYSIGGLIRDKWVQNGSEGGWLGYPTSDETVVGQGRMNRFERGFIYWSPATGAFPVSGPIFDKWAAAGYEGGTYGFPTGDQTSPDGGVMVEQQFQGGKISTPGANAVELALRSAGSTAQQVVAAAQSYAASVSASVAEVLSNALGESRQAVPLLPVGDPSPGNDQILPTPRGPGDIWVSDAATGRANHGHNGIFVTMTHTVEAGDGGVRRHDMRVDGGRKMRSPILGWVNTGSDVRASAVSFAEGRVGKGYNNQFAWNKNIYDEQYNCSQLVWASYMEASDDDIDLDGDGGMGVYPRDIFKSSWVTKYP